MKEMRRLEIPSRGDAFERGRTSPVRSFDIVRQDMDRLQRERPELVVAEDAGVMALHPQGKAMWLYYGFARLDALRLGFRPLLERLTGSLKANEGKAGIFLRFADQPNRPYIEPVLADCSFEAVEEWMELVLPSLPEELLPTDEIVPGFLLRPVVPADYEAVAALDRVAFGDEDVLGAGDVADIAERAAELRVLEDRESGRPAGYIGLFLRGERVGEVTPLAVHPDFQRRGLGEAMVRWGLAWFREQGLRRAKVLPYPDYGAALALYRKLGFAHERSGLTYRRPTDKRDLARLEKKRRGTYVKFGDWR